MSQIQSKLLFLYWVLRQLLAIVLAIHSANFESIETVMDHFLNVILHDEIQKTLIAVKYTRNISRCLLVADCTPDKSVSATIWILKARLWPCGDAAAWLTVLPPSESQSLKQQGWLGYSLNSIASASPLSTWVIAAFTALSSKTLQVLTIISF